MNIEDRMSLWAAKRPREEPAELMLEGAQEIADLRRQREEDGKQMSALIEGYQKMQALCVDGKHLTDEERDEIEGIVSDFQEIAEFNEERCHPHYAEKARRRAAMLIGLLERLG
jgi:hypothetical protein